MKIKFYSLFAVFVVFLLFGCASTSTILSKTREINVPELDGKIYISAIQYAGKSVQLTQNKFVKVNEDTKRLAILSFQIQNVKRKKIYDFSSIVLLDDDTRISPDAIKYFRGNTSIGMDWGVGTKSLFSNSLTMVRNRKGKYTVNLIYAVDTDKLINKADFFGQIIEFEKETVRMNVIDKFH